MEPASKHMLSKGSSGHLEDEKEINNRNGMRGRNRFLFWLRRNGL